MRKEIADLSVRFGADGTRGLRQDIDRVRDSIGKLKAVSFSAIGGIGKIGLGLGAGALAGVGALTALAAANDDYVEQISRLSNLSGIQIEAMSRLAAGARRYGVDLDDLRGAMGQFIGQVAEGAGGAAIAEDFAKLGISAEELSANLEDPLKILLSVAKAQKDLKGAERTGLLSKLFGEDDLVKMVNLLDALGSGSDDLVEAIGNIDDAGAIVTADDVKLSREWNNVVGEMGDIFRGLSLEIGRTVLPTITEFTGAFAGFIRDNKEIINGNIAGAWRRVGRAIEPVYDYFYAGERAVGGTWLEPVIRWLRQAGESVGTLLRGTGDLFDAMSGRRISTEFPWMTDFASGIKRMAEGGVNAIDFLTGGVGQVVSDLVPLLGGLPGVIDGVEASWAMLQAGFENGIGSGFLAETGRLFRILWDGSIGVRDALIAIANGEPVDAQFAWVESAVTAFGDIASLSGEFLTQLVSATGQVIDQFGDIRLAIENAWGVDITQLGMWVAFAQFSGVANTFLIAGGIVLGVLGSIAGAAVIGGIALGVFIGKMLEAQEWANKPVRMFEGFIDEMTGDAGRMREFWEQERERSERWLQERAELYGMTPDELREQGRNSPILSSKPAQAAQEPVVQYDLEELLALARSYTDGSALNHALTFQQSIAEVEASKANLGKSVVVEGRQSGVPILIQLSPTGEQVELSAEDEDIVEKLVDMVYRAERASATKTQPSFATGGRK